MREIIEANLASHSIYTPRRREFDTGERVPFRVSPKPFTLTTEQQREISSIGNDISCYFTSVDSLYRTNEEARTLLDTGKPEIFLMDENRPTQYLFIRPDLIINPNGFTICEVETSPFGLALAEILNRSYRQQDFETLICDGELPNHVKSNTPQDGVILYSRKTNSYAGQMTFLAEQIFSSDNRDWKALHAEDAPCADYENLYRGFYLSELLTDATIKTYIDEKLETYRSLLPSATPHMEEKAILALIWDSRFEIYFKKMLGQGTFNHLREVIPPTWIVGQEAYFAPGLPNGISRSIDLATVSRSKRTFVLKQSGFGDDSSWSQGVNLLHQKSSKNAEELLMSAQQEESRLNIIQEFREGTKIPLSYQEPDGGELVMQAKVRLTPYFSVAPGQEGRMIAIKATGCEGTDFIHATSSSINTAVM